MGIHDDDLDRVRKDSDIVQVISGYTQLKRSGTRFTGLCPFHSERSGSFSVNAADNLYYCFGCQAKGDVITFVREKEGLDFVGAVEWLAQKMGLQLRYTDAGEGKDRQRKGMLSDLIGRAADWYHDLLLTSPEAAPARAYLRQRGLNGELVRQFKIGWAPDEWDALAKHLRASDKDFTDSGLGLVNRRNRQQDWFRGRILFPIADAQGKPVGFGGRIMPGGEGAKYINSRDSVVYNKSGVLYGLDRAKSDIVNAGEVVICEGYTDVIGYHIAGVPRAVATCGTALTEEHVKLLKKFGSRVVLSFDGDKAGQAAAEKFYAWERTYDLDVRVVDLPEGADPGDLALSDPKQLARGVTEARPFLEFRVNRVLKAASIDSVEGRARAAEDALSVLAEHPDALVQDAYALQIADHTQMAPDTIRAMLKRATPRKPGERSTALGRSGSDGNARNRAVANQPRDTGSRGGGVSTLARFVKPVPATELEALRLALHRTDEIAGLVVPELFTEQHLGDIYALITEHRNINRVIELADSESTELLYRLSVESTDADPVDVASLLWGRFLAVEKDKRMRQYQNGTAQDMEALTAELRWFQTTKEALREPGTKNQTVADLLAWLLSTSEEAG